ncbi:MAG: molybdopterin-guanine dinucleotide biosynthesis protein B [Thermoprotei archaeon]|nr:molybdopterin-guanine dinucleotide biosynthesis protein B [Thermoprotei archaeon]
MVLCVVQVVGPSGSGKTSSIVRSAMKFKAMGLKVAVLKHTHHQVDVAHKDSWRFIEEGLADYSIVVMGSGERVAVFLRDSSLDEVMEIVEGKVDVVLIEGFKYLNFGYKVETGLGADPERVSEAIVEACLSQRRG